MGLKVWVGMVCDRRYSSIDVRERCRWYADGQCWERAVTGICGDITNGRDATPGFKKKKSDSRLLIPSSGLLTVYHRPHFLDPRNEFVGAGIALDVPVEGVEFVDAQGSLAPPGRLTDSNDIITRVEPVPIHWH
ncbi:hypothetical protein KCV07_g509, partial [Aureobasidium melanogenum]